MELPLISMDRNEARKAFLEYRNSVRAAANRDVSEYETRLERRKREMAEQDASLMKGYRLLSLGRQIISLADAVIGGGFDDQNRPKLAVGNASDRSVRLDRHANGRMTFRGIEDWHKHETPPRGSLRVFEFDVPPIPGMSWVQAEAMVPSIPPHLRPETIDRYVILWEAEWRARRAPVDPALLRPLGNGLYAVVATWDLTPLEQMVLGLAAR